VCAKTSAMRDTLLIPFGMLCRWFLVHKLVVGHGRRLAQMARQTRLYLHLHPHRRPFVQLPLHLYLHKRRLRLAPMV
jgi:hypothetical protein